MNARLIAVEAPAAPDAVPLTPAGLTIGRAPENGFVVPERSVSRRHCAIAFEKGRYIIRDLDSQNGTAVNGVPVRERTLSHGDEIRIGHCRFRFLDADQESSVAMFADGPVASETVMLDASDVFQGAARDLKAVLSLSSALGALTSADEIARRLLEAAMSAIPAQRGAVLLEDTVVALPGGPFPLCRDITDRVLRSGAAAMGGGLAAVPLTSRGRTAGVLYLEGANVAKPGIELLAALATIGAVAIENAARFETLKTEVRIEHEMVGGSPAMRKVYDFIARVAPSESTVLIGGESGTGKELVARAIHRNSPRANGPFVAINCAALAESLLESELFGHERGAFTGAVTQKKGKLEIAAGGTLFLDEIGELAPALQAKLLRVLQQREFERVGGTRPLKADVRVVAATNKRLDEEAAASRFRQDLYYRLNVVSITLPPLRERREDIGPLASHFAAQFRAGGISSEALGCLTRYDWPGNVRELENAIERAAVLGASETIRPEDLPEGIAEAEPAEGEPVSGFHEAVREAKKQIIRRSLEESGGSHAAAARLLGVNPKYLFRLIRNLGLR